MVKEKTKPISQKIKSEDFIYDGVHCSGIFRINEDTEEILFGEEVYKLEKIKILREENGDRIFIYKGDEKWITLSKELYDSAQKVFDIWYDKAIEFMIAKKKDCPFILVSKPLAIVIAPRIESE